MPNTINNHCGFAPETNPITFERQEFRDFLLADEATQDAILLKWNRTAIRNRFLPWAERPELNVDHIINRSHKNLPSNTIQHSDEENPHADEVRPESD